jgi:hypothetical protein
MIGRSLLAGNRQATFRGVRFGDATADVASLLARNSPAATAAANDATLGRRQNDHTVPQPLC